jgi:hypothetical protein
MAEWPVLDLRRLAEGLPGITPAYGAAMAEAGAVVLKQSGHAPGVAMAVDGGFRRTYSVAFDAVGAEAERAWADEPYATEQGAYGVACLLACDLTPHTVIERSRKGTGFDYWLGARSADDGIFQRKARLEVSGMRRGSVGGLASRVRAKADQTMRSDGPIPAYVIVVEFGTPRARVTVR